MYNTAKYFLPAACFLLITVFFMLLPDLRVCRLGTGEHRLDRWDALLMAVITLLYAAAGFYGLGDRRAPQSFENMEGRTARLAPDASAPAARLMLYTGVGIGGYSIDWIGDAGESLHLADLEQSHAEVLKWHPVELETPVTGGTLLIEGRGNVWLGEAVVLTEDGRQLSAEADLPALTDEQTLCPARQTFMNSSFFDEIYHARTAWEHLNGVYPYEITHPPLGKLIIGLGISLFGMTPFGWRFSGTLFGVLMLPILYYFAKKLFGGRITPAACMILMATDFMHFVQTRIATIDTYAVFFILLMYLFMYLFLTEGRLRDLALCGLSFGLGAASKWTCFYAGAGLALLQEADILLLGEMGIGNTTTATAVASVLLDLPPEALTGRGAGLSDRGLEQKRRVIREAIAVNAPDPQDPIEVLCKLGGLDLAALCGACLGAAVKRTPVLLDGVITAAAALCAARLCPQARDAMLASHVSAEPAGRLLLRELGLHPLLDAGLRLGEGSGAVAALPLLDMALSVYNSGHGFDALGIRPYTPQGG